MGETQEKLRCVTNIPVKTRVPIWNSLVRGALTYPLQTMTLNQTQQQRQQGFTNRCIKNVIYHERSENPNYDYNARMIQLRAHRPTKKCMDPKIIRMTHDQTNTTRLANTWTDAIGNDEFKTRMGRITGRPTKSNKTISENRY